MSLLFKIWPDTHITETTLVAAAGGLVYALHLMSLLF
jgi:hypothetical protein